MAARKTSKTEQDCIDAILAAPTLAAGARVIDMNERAFRTVVRSCGTYVSGKNGDDARTLTSDTLARVLARPSVRKHATDAGYVFGE